MRETTRDGIRSPVVGPGQRMLMFWGVDKNLPPVVTVPEVGRRIGFSQTSVEGISHSSVTSGRYGEASYSAHGKRVIVTPAVYPRLDEPLLFDIQSTGQKSHCVNISL